MLSWGPHSLSRPLMQKSLGHRVLTVCSKINRKQPNPIKPLKQAPCASLLAENCTLMGATRLANEGLENSQLVEEQGVTKESVSQYTTAKLGVVLHRWKQPFMRARELILLKWNHQHPPFLWIQRLTHLFLSSLLSFRFVSSENDTDQRVQIKLLGRSWTFQSLETISRSTWKVIQKQWLFLWLKCPCEDKRLLENHITSHHQLSQLTRNARCIFLTLTLK